MSKTTILVTGSKAGIGKGLLSTYAARDNVTAIAAIRDGPESIAASELTSLPVGRGSKIIVAQYDAGSPTSAKELVSFLESAHSIKHLDVVVANAGILKHFGPAKDTSVELLNEHFQINSLGPIILYQATHSLLRAATTPKFFIISSSLGSVEAMETIPMPMLAYGMSKAAVNYFSKKAHMEDDKIALVAFQPGWVQTDMGAQAAAYAGMPAADVPVTLEDGVSGLMQRFDAATKETMSGTFQNVQGTTLPW